jgi:hypothetical protein
MYQDIKGLVTVAVGNLIDRPEDAAALSWVHIDTGLAATRDEIVAGGTGSRRRRAWPAAWRRRRSPR